MTHRGLMERAAATLGLCILLSLRSGAECMSEDRVLQ